MAKRAPPRPLEPKERAHRTKKASAAFLLIVGCYALAPFAARAALEPASTQWARTLNAVVSLLLVVLGLLMTFVLARQARGTKLQAGASILGWLVNLTGLLVYVLAIQKDQTTFLSTMAGIGAGIITQAAFYYGFVDAPNEPRQAAHRDRLLQILNRARR